MAVQGLSSCGAWALEHTVSVVEMLGLSCPEACRILVLWPGIKPASPTLQGRFLTTRPWRKSPLVSSLQNGPFGYTQVFCVYQIRCFVLPRKWTLLLLISFQTPTDRSLRFVSHMTINLCLRCLESRGSEMCWCPEPLLLVHPVWLETCPGTTGNMLESPQGISKESWGLAQTGLN